MLHNLRSMLRSMLLHRDEKPKISLVAIAYFSNNGPAALGFRVDPQSILNASYWRRGLAQADELHLWARRKDFSQCLLSTD
jgi:hypothetical protein